MPGFDGTGPSGGGPRTGRGKGGCGRLVSGLLKTGRGRRTVWLGVIGAVAGDLVNPDGITRRIAAGLGNTVKRLAGSRKSELADPGATTAPPSHLQDREPEPPQLPDAGRTD